MLRLAVHVLVPESPFLPARSKLEAVSRISAVTRSGPEELGPGSKERKRVLTNLAHGFHLAVDSAASKPVLGAALASGLDIEWDAECWSAGDTITLRGLNRLLEGAERLANRVQFDWTSTTFALEKLTGHTTFVPATNKLEAVNRIAALTASPAESLGPGSKEHKSVLVNLATGLRLGINANATKPELGGQICKLLGVPWDPRCWSSGSTITLDGLNRLLYGAERALARWDRNWPGPPAIEAGALLEVLATVVRGRWDGRACIEEMRLAEHPHWAQDEWPGFYFEFVGLPALINTFGGGPIRIANTVFDYCLRRIWDLKAHSAQAGPKVILNDRNAVQSATTVGGGLGFLILSADVTYDDEFRVWQGQYRSTHGKPRKLRDRPVLYRRRGKSAASPLELLAFCLPDSTRMTLAEERGEMGLMRQGRQVGGQPRALKSMMSLDKAVKSDLMVARRLIHRDKF